MSETDVESTETKKSNSSGVVWISLLAMVIAVGSLGAGFAIRGELRYEVYNKFETQLKLEIATLQKKIEQQNQTQQQKLSQLVIEKTKGFQNAISKLEQSQKRYQQMTLDVVSGLHRKAGRNRNEWILAEVEYLIQVANHRILLERDVNTAIATLTLADQRLREMGDPALMPIREILAQEIGQLKEVNLPDIEGYALILTGLLARVDQYPIIEPETHDNTRQIRQTTSQSKWDKTLQDMWQGFQQLIVVRHNNKPISAMLAPQERYFLLQNLRLKLEASRLALLREDKTLYKQNLKTSKQWLTAWFDTDANSVKSALQQLSDLENIDISPTLPDISGSLRALRNLPEREQVVESVKAMDVKALPVLNNQQAQDATVDQTQIKQSGGRNNTNIKPETSPEIDTSTTENNQ